MMNKKFRNLAFLSLGCAALLAPFIVNAHSEEMNLTRADYTPTSYTVTSSNFHLNYSDGTSSGDIVFFKLPEWTMGTTEARDSRFKGDAVVTHIKADGTEKAYKVNVAKQVVGDESERIESGWCVQFDCWDKVNVFTVEVGESIRLNGTATRDTGAYAGDSITFDNITLTRYEADRWGAEKVVHKFNKNDLALGTQNATTLYFNDKTGTDYACSREIDWTISVFKAKNAVTYTNAATGESTLYDCGFKLVHQSATAPTSLCFQVNNSWKGVTIPVTPGVGDTFVISNQLFTLNYCKTSTIYDITIEYIQFAWDGSKWSCPIADTITYNYGMDDIIGTSTDCVPGRQYEPRLKLESNDQFPVNNSWAAYYVMKNGGTIYPADGSEPVVRDLMFMKLKESEYQILFYNAEAWTQPWYYEFQKGDRMIINGSITTTYGYDKFVVNMTNIDMTFTGSKFDLNYYRPGLIQKAHDAIAAIGDVSLTPACREKIDTAMGLVAKLVPAETADFSLVEMNTVYKADRDYRVLEAEAAGKTIHRNNLTKEDYYMSGSVAESKFFTLQFNEGVVVDYPLKNAWDVGLNQSLNSSKITTAEGVVSFIPSDCVFTEPGEGKEACDHIVFYYVPWGRPTGEIANDYKFVNGDTLEIGPTGFTKVVDNDFYICEFEGIELIFTEKAFLLVSEAPNLVDAVRAINAIGEVELTAASKEKIDAARTAFDNLSTSEQNDIPSTQEILVAAEIKYKELNDKDLASKVVEKINAIGTVEYTPECKAKIDEARSAYNAATIDVKQYITDDELKVLTDAEAKYLELGYQKEAAEVVEKINAIGTVEYTPECKAKIDEARSAYNACSDGAKDMITVEQYAVLTDAEAAYARLKATDDFISEVAKLNDGLGVEQMYSIINNALKYYNKIEDKASVATEYATLQTYIAKYNAMIAPINEAHQEATSSALSLINVVLTATSLLAVAAIVLSKKGIL